MVFIRNRKGVGYNVDSSEKSLTEKEVDSTSIDLLDEFKSLEQAGIEALNMVEYGS